MSDLIDRQKVLETIDSRIEQIKKNTNAMNKSYPHLSFAEGVHDGYCRLKCDLRILPSVSVSENPNKCGDLISRQAVLDGIAEWIVSGYADSEADCSHISSLVTHLPSVENKGDFDGMTNGEVIQTLFPNSKFTKMGYGNIEFAVDGFVFGLTDRWLNAPYKAEKPETCKGCLEPCIMYEPDMRACKKKVREVSE